jgi:hypothetical protein
VVDGFQTETSGKFDPHRKVSRWNRPTFAEFAANGVFAAAIFAKIAADGVFAAAIFAKFAADGVFAAATFAAANITSTRSTITSLNSKYGNVPTAAACSTTQFTKLSQNSIKSLPMSQPAAMSQQMH